MHNEISILARFEIPARALSVALIFLGSLACHSAGAVDIIATSSKQTLSQPDTHFPPAQVHQLLAASSNAINPFRISVPDSAIADLRQRLSLTRLPDQLNEVSWEYGTDLEYLKELLDYWRTEFNWRTQEEMLNQFSQFKTTIENIDVHFIHQRSSHENAIPLLLVHGWPGSVSEFSQIIGPLTDPTAHGGSAEDAFHVIAPSLPGFGFSSAPTEPGFGPEQMALAFADLMERLGYEQYALAGGDWGAIINRHLANHYPERLIGLHSNMVLAGPPSDPAQRDAVLESEAAVVEARRNYMLNEVGYQQIQGTKPQTLGYGLNDSPAGLAAWIVEKFHGWSDLSQDESGNLDNNFSKDEILTNISIYWFTGSITSSARIYYENRNSPPLKPMTYIDVPTGAAIFPAEIYILPRAWVEAAYDLRQWTVMPEGGHFAALEQPQSYLQDLRVFYRSLR
jgi:microsomal epoxide hydrolase